MAVDWLKRLFVAVTLVAAAAAFEVKLDATEDNKRQCSGMYSRSAWGGPAEPSILVKFLNSTDSTAKDPVVSLLIFEWKDEELLGIPDPVYPSQRLLEQCTQDSVKKKLCDQDDIGQFVLAPNATRKSINKIETAGIHLNNAKPKKYSIENTGYYCVFTEEFTASDWEAVVEFRNAYGELPASIIPKLPFYGGITILYTLVAVFWGFLYYQHRQDILPVQNYITAILIFLVIEMLMTWGYYQHLNVNGANIGSRVLLIIVAVLNAARNSFSFFLLLIVCMGYGVVKPTLGRTMIYVRWLAIVHFIFGLAYVVTTLLVSPEDTGIFLLFVALPLAATLTAFYVWTLNSLNLTLKDLRERKQYVKEGMYKKLWWCILVSILVIFAFFFFNSFTIASSRDDEDFVPYHWKTRWFILDGWLNLVYFADVAWIAYVWRPTANNRRFAMSDELAQDDDGTFEIGDIGAPDDSDDEEAQVGTGKRQQQPSPAVNLGSSAGQPAQAPASQGRPLARESLDGETIFAVGDDGDKMSDDDSDEDSKLVRPR